MSNSAKTGYKPEMNEEGGGKRQAKIARVLP